MTDQPEPSIIHRAPTGCASSVPCCGEQVFDLPRTDRMTVDGDVTCSAPGLTEIESAIRSIIPGIRDDSTVTVRITELDTHGLRNSWTGPVSAFAVRIHDRVGAAGTEVARLRAELADEKAAHAKTNTAFEDYSEDAAGALIELRTELEQARAPIYDNATRALDYLAALDTSHMSTDAIGLGLHIVAMLDGPGDPTATPTPACTCSAEPVHQAGCPSA